MTSVRCFWLIAGALLSALCTASPEQRSNESSITVNTTLSVSFIGDNRPWTFSSSLKPVSPQTPAHNSVSDPLRGYTQELIHQTLLEMGWETQSQFMTPRRVTATLLGDLIDAATLMISPSGAILPPSNFQCSLPYLDVPWHIYYRTNTPMDIDTSELLLGVVKYPGYENYYTEFPMTFSAYKSNLQLYRSLKAQRIHGLISNENLMDYWRPRLNLEVVQGEYLGYTHMVMCFSKARLGIQAANALAERFTPTLKRLIAEQPQRFSSKALKLFTDYNPMRDGNPGYEYEIEDARQTPDNNRQRSQKAQDGR